MSAMRTAHAIVRPISLAVFAASACTTYTPANDAGTDSTRTTAVAESSASHYVDGGDSMRFVVHDENLPPGFPMNATAMAMRNPYENDKQAISTGGKLFIAYNCIDCHGADGS